MHFDANVSAEELPDEDIDTSSEEEVDITIMTHEVVTNLISHVHHIASSLTNVRFQSFLWSEYTDKLTKMKLLGSCSM